MRPFRSTLRIAGEKLRPVNIRMPTGITYSLTLPPKTRRYCSRSHTVNPNQQEFTQANIDRQRQDVSTRSYAQRQE